MLLNRKSTFSEKVTVNRHQVSPLLTVSKTENVPLIETCLYIRLVLDQNHYLNFGPILKLKPKLADTFGRYCNPYQNHILKGESSNR
jgi:hypothetical protein